MSYIRARVLEMEIELSDCLLAILIPLESIYLHNHMTFSDKVSSLIPFLCMSTTVAKIAGAVMIRLSERLYTIW
jgi:hypothetical protein